MRLSMTRRVCASMPSGSALASSSGQVGICPVTNSQPSVSTAWLNGATGVGAPGIMWKVGGLMGFSRSGAGSGSRLMQHSTPDATPPSRRLMSTTAIKHADWVIAWNESQSRHEYLRDGDVVFDGDRI